MSGVDITVFPIHLGLGATAKRQPRFTGDMNWYGDYAQRHGEDGAEGRLVAMHSFTRSWEMWEMHPEGSEVVLCIAGSLRLLQEAADGELATVTLAPGEYAINQPETWHTADVDDEATVLFVTAGLNTQHRPR